MEGRGRKSTAALTVVESGRTSAIQRPSPPKELTKEQRDEWNAIVDRMPADWFLRETFPLLTAYCRHAVTQRHIGQLIAELEGGTDEEGIDLRDYNRLLAMQERESRSISMLATKMRLSQQSFYDKQKRRGNPSTGKKPWDG